MLVKCKVLEKMEKLWANYNGFSFVARDFENKVSHKFFMRDLDCFGLEVFQIFLLKKLVASRSLLHFEPYSYKT